MIAIATNAYESHCFDILLAKIRSVTTGKCFQIQLPEAVTRSCSVKKMSLKILQYSQEKTCVGVSFNKVAGLNQIQVFFCEYCNIFKNNFFYRPPFRRATKGGGVRPPLPFFKNHKKCPNFGKKGPDSDHLWVKFSVQNAVLRVSRRKTSKISPSGAFFS